jgi:fatty-acyl-CoA synthase
MFVDRVVSMVRLFTLIRRTLRHTPTSPYTVGDLVEERAAAHPERPFLLFEARRICYADFNAAANRVAHWAQRAGLRVGDRVALLMHNRPEYVFAWAGLAKLGVVVPLINPNLRGETLRHVLAAADTRWLIVGAECLENLATVNGQSSPIDHLFVWPEPDANLTPWPRSRNGKGEGKEDSGPPPRFGEGLGERSLLTPLLDAMPTHNPDRRVRHGLVAGDDLFYIFTSGTTGYPKPARLSHMRFIAIGDGMAGVAGYGAADVIYCPIPLYHGAGGVVVPASVLHAGAAMVLRRKFSASAFWDDCRRFGATGFQYVGEICQFLLSQPLRPTDRTHRVRVMMGTGLRADLWHPFQQRFGVARIIESYGSTEGNTSIINLDNKPGSIGRIPFKKLHSGRLIRFDIETETHARNAAGFCIECESGEIGEFIGRIRGAKDKGVQRFEGYTSPEETERKILRNVFERGDAWFRTGDLLRRDADDYFYFVDRIGDTFRWKSENVSTQEVAAILNTFPGVEIANVYGVEVPGDAGRAGMAALVLQASTAFDGRAFYAFTETHLPRYAAPLFLRLPKEADMTGTLKLRKMTLQRDGYDPQRVKDPLYVRDEQAGAYVPLTVERADGLVPGRQHRNSAAVCSS